MRRYVRDAGPLLDQLNELQRCDCTTRNERKARALERRMDELVARIETLAAEEELKAIRPPLDGRQVMEFLGVPPGRVIGEALDFLLEARLDEGPIDGGRRVRSASRPGRASAASSPPEPARPARAQAKRIVACRSISLRSELAMKHSWCATATSRCTFSGWCPPRR